MSAQILEYWRLVGEGIALSFSRAPRFEYTPDPAGWFIYTGEPFVDFNCALVASGTSADSTLESAVERFKNASAPFLICILGNSPLTARNAEKLGLKPAGLLPLMIFDQSVAPSEKPVGGLSLREPASPTDYRLDASLAEGCFGLPRDAIERVMPFDSEPDPNLRTLLAFRDDELVGSVAMSFQSGATGIWSLKTRPDLRRQGIGWHVMQQALAMIRARSSDPVFLVSTPVGKPLYDRLGFRTIDKGIVWTMQI